MVFISAIKADFLCGQCTCANDLIYMICNGGAVNEFPWLPAQDYMRITYIEIRNSLMTSLPVITSQDFPNLILVTIFDNMQLHCAYVQQWADVLPPYHVNTDCILYYSTPLTNYTDGTTQSTKWIYSTPLWNETMTYVTPTFQGNETQTTEPNLNEADILILIFVILCTIIIVLLIVMLIVCACVKKRKSNIYTGAAGTSMNNLFHNDLFYMNMHEDISEV